MTDISVQPPAVRELVGLFADPAALTATIEALLADGFSHADVSVLSSHAAIEAAGKGSGWRERLIPLISEKRYEVPLLTGAFIAIATGPVGAAIAGLVTAGVGAAALLEIFDEVVSLPNTQEFAQAVARGELILWVAVADDAAEARARMHLEHGGARGIHRNDRTQSPS